MPNPSLAQVNPVNIPLTNVAMKYLLDRDDFVADKVFPPVMVPRSSGSFFVFDKGDLLRDEMEERAPGTQAKRAGYRLSNTPYMCKDYALSEAIPDERVADSVEPINNHEDVTEDLIQKYLIKKEKLWAASYFGNGIWTGAPDGAAWNWSQAAADPISDILTLGDTIKASCGRFPNTLVIGKQAFRMATQSATVLNRIQYTQRGAVTKEILGSLLSDSANQPMQILVLDGIENTAAEGQAANMAQIGDGASALLCYSAPSPGKRRPSAGYQFIWERFPGGMGPALKTFRDENIASDIVQLDVAVDFQVTGSDLGGFQSAITA